MHAWAAADEAATGATTTSVANLSATPCHNIQKLVLDMLRYLPQQ
jgi:hypothetical protein